MNQSEITTRALSDMTMDLLLKRLSEESPHLSNPEDGHGILEIVYNFNSAPKISDRYSIIKAGGKGLEVSFPSKTYDEKLLKKNIQMLYYIVNQYLSTRLIPQGKLTVEFANGTIIDCYVNNEGTYKDLERTGRPKLGLDDFLFDEDKEDQA